MADWRHVSIDNPDDPESEYTVVDEEFYGLDDHVCRDDHDGHCGCGWPVRDIEADDTEDDD